MADLLLYAAPERSPDMFHELPLPIGDPFPYIEAGGRRAALIGVLDADKVRALGVEVLDPGALGADELLAAGGDRLAIDAELLRRACAQLGLVAAIVPPDFPLFAADHLRAAGVRLSVDADGFMLRRRSKSAAELAGIRRAQKAADVAMGVARQLIHELAPGLTSEHVRAALQATVAEHGAELGDEAIVAHGAQAASGHESGHGEIVAGESVVVDIWPRDRASRCYADMTRTFVAGGGTPDARLAELWQLTHASLQLVAPKVAPGVDGGELFALSCEPFQVAGHPTQLTKAPGEPLRDGYFHSLGHGVGLDVHERPYLGRRGDELLAGDVITLEPGCYVQGFGGCRLEDLVLVSDDGFELLTDFPYDL